jgi:nitrite reductase/ring-hydroxylating ferredoxin subunit
MSFHQVAKVSEIPPGQLREVEVKGQTYVICNLDGNFYAIGGVCPHMGGPLGQGELQQTHVVCPWHGWEFDCRTGENDFDPTITAGSYTVKVEDGAIYLDVPDGA